MDGKARAKDKAGRAKAKERAIGMVVATGMEKQAKVEDLAHTGSTNLIKGQLEMIVPGHFP